MFELIQNHMTEVFTNILVVYITAMLAPINFMVRVLATAGGMHDLTRTPWATNLITGMQGVAFSLLSLRLAWESLQQALLRAEGGLTDAGGLVKKAAMSAAAIIAAPWLARQMLVVGNMFAQAVAQAGFGVGLEGLDFASLSLGAPGPAELVLTIIPMVILLPLILFQALVRTIEMLLAAIIAPLAALGLMSDGGMAETWWREVLILCMTQAVQVLMLYVAVASLVAPAHWGELQQVSGPFLAVATLWVAWRTPHILRNYAYGSGTRAVGGGIGQVLLKQAILRR